MSSLRVREALPATETAPRQHVAGFDQTRTALAQAHPHSLRIISRMLVALIALLALLGTRPEPANTASVVTVSSLSALQNAVRNASKGGTVYLAGGTYGSVTLNSHRKTWVTVRPASGASVHLADLNFGSNASHIAVRRLHVDGDVDLAPTGADHIQIFDSDLSGVSAKWGTNHIRIVHNWIHDCSNCVELVSTASNVPGAPDPSATDLPPVRNIKIVGNRIARPDTDAIFMGNYRHIRVEGNEITGVIENGNHNDALQSVYGGDDLTFRGNYVHDNHGEGFFIKDGRATNVEVSNNLFVRTTGPLWQLMLYRTIGAVIKRNTAWNCEAPFILEEANNRRVVIRNNVLNGMYVQNGSESYYRNRAVLDQHDNVIRGGWNWGATSRDKTVRPDFRAPGSNDFRLTKAQVRRIGLSAGVTWAVRRRVFGPR
jgi:parallel beta helix pectate lyase-like protein